MELNDGTLQVLKNFSGINPNIMIREGNVLRKVNEARNIIAHADITENFPKDFGIYDLNEFIGVLSLVDKPRLKFNDEYVTVGDSTGRSKIKYFFSAEEVLTKAPEKIKMPDCEIKFLLTNDTLNKLKRAASTLGHEEVSISGKDGVLSLSVVDTKNSTSNQYSIDIDGEFNPDSSFNIILNIGNLKILPGDYNVEVSSKLISQFSHTELPVKYWIAFEKTSNFGV